MSTPPRARSLRLTGQRVAAIGFFRGLRRSLRFIRILFKRIWRGVEYFAMQDSRRLLTEACPEEMVLCDRTGEIVSGSENPAFLALERKAKESGSSIFPRDHKLLIYSCLNSRRKEERASLLIIGNVEIHVRYIPVGKRVALYYRSTDADYRKAIEAEVQRLRDADELDKLTQTLNKGCIEKKLQLLVREVRDGRREALGVFMFDIDHFKSINDTSLDRHRTGDEALQVVAHHAKSALREGDLIGRVGGDEFLVILPNLHRERAREVLRKVVRRLKKDLSKPMTLRGDTLRLHLSVGADIYAGGEMDAGQLVIQVDRAMYVNKTQRKDGNDVLLHFVRKAKGKSPRRKAS